MKITALVYLEWPEKCFRVDAAALARLKGLLPAGSAVVRARTEAAFLKALPKATHVLTWRFEAAWFARAPKLRLLATPAAGRELVSEAAPKGVRVHFGTFHGEVMAENVAAFALAWARGFLKPELRRSPWPRTELSSRCTLVAGTRAVIVGYGHIGRAIGAKLSALGVSVTGIRRANLAELPRAAKLADWLVFALPSTTGTDDFLNARLIRQLPRRCVVMNVGRGNAIDEAALARALETRRLAAAYVDVRKHEPSGTVPEFGANVSALEKLENFFQTPHSSAFAPTYMRLFIDELAREGLLK